MRTCVWHVWLLCLHVGASCSLFSVVHLFSYVYFQKSSVSSNDVFFLSGWCEKACQYSRWKYIILVHVVMHVNVR